MQTPKSETKYNYAEEQKDKNNYNQKISHLSNQATVSEELTQSLNDIFVITRIIAFERYNFICGKQQKNETLKQLHANLVELAARAVCGDPEE